MTIGREKRAIAAVAVGLGVATIAACGGGAKRAPRPVASPQSIAAIRDAPAKTVAARTSRVSFTVTMTGVPGAGGPLNVTGNGAFDYDARKGSLTYSLPSVRGQSLGEIEAVSDGTTMYERFPPALAQQFPEGKPWVKVDLQQLSQTAGVDLNSLSQFQSGNPGQAFDYLKGAGDVTRIGPDRVRGDAVTHYKTTLDLNQAASSGGQSSAAVQQATKLLGTSSFPADIWLDDQGRVRKMTYSIDLSKSSLPSNAGNRPGGTMTYTLEAFDFGVTVSADPPPADQVSDLGALSGALGQQAGG